MSHNFIQSVYSDVAHPGLQGDTDQMDRLQELVPQESRGLDAGCGAGARDVFFYWQGGYDIYERTFQVYDVDDVLCILEGRDLRVIPPEGVNLGGVMYFKDPKPMDHCVFFARKDG